VKRRPPTQHRLLFEVTWEALDDAAVDPEGLLDSRTGVFVGVSTNDYGLLANRTPKAVNAYMAIGNSKSLAANRISHALALAGPSMIVDAACAWSLVCVHLACRSLQVGESEVAMAGGVNVMVRRVVFAPQRQRHSLRRVDATARRVAGQEERGKVIVVVGHRRDYLGCSACPASMTTWSRCSKPPLFAGHKVGPAQLERLWTLTGDDDRQRLDEFLQAVAPQQPDGLPLRVGQWTIDLGEAAVRSAVMSAFVATALIPQGMTEFVIGFATAIIPSVVEIKRVSLGAGDERLLVGLRSKLASGNEDELYAALSPETRDEINRYDFADVINRLREAGFAHGTDEMPLLLKPPGGDDR
jgi:hypothetical protein